MHNARGPLKLQKPLLYITFHPSMATMQEPATSFVRRTFRWGKGGWWCHWQNSNKPYDAAKTLHRNTCHQRSWRAIKIVAMQFLITFLHAQPDDVMIRLFVLLGTSIIIMINNISLFELRVIYSYDDALRVLRISTTTTDDIMMVHNQPYLTVCTRIVWKHLRPTPYAFKLFTSGFRG